MGDDLQVRVDPSPTDDNVTRVNTYEHVPYVCVYVLVVC